MSEGLPKVLNKRNGGIAYTSYQWMSVDRGTSWGNPFVMEREADRDKVCDFYEQYAAWRLTVEPDWLEPLRGRDLACWCAPKRCHADTLIRLANEKPVPHD